MKQIRNLLNRPDHFDLKPFLVVGLLTILGAGALVAWQAGGPTQHPQSPSPQPKASPYTKWLEEDAVYIITDRERTAFLGLRSDKEREHFIEQFWERRNPDPSASFNPFKEEHYRRIAYANERFAAKVPGWKTDRGRIYIMYGPPDEIESHPSGGLTIAKNYPFEQWRYRYLQGIGTNVIVEFDDMARTGEYKMTKDPNPNTGK